MIFRTAILFTLYIIFSSLKNPIYDGIFITNPSGITEKFRYSKTHTIDSATDFGICYVTEYKIYTTKEFIHSNNILVANYKNSKLVTVVMEQINKNNSLWVIKRNSFNYNNLNTSSTFGINPKGYLLPYQVGVKYVSTKQEHLSLVSFLVHEYENEDVYVITLK